MEHVNMNVNAMSIVYLDAIRIGGGNLWKAFIVQKPRHRLRLISCCRATPDNSVFFVLSGTAVPAWRLFNNRLPITKPYAPYNFYEAFQFFLQLWGMVNSMTLPETFNQQS